MKFPTATPDLQLDTLFIRDARQRIVSTREPHPSSGPAFIFIRGESTCAWAVRADIPEPVVLENTRLAKEEPPSAVWDQPLRHVKHYTEFVGQARHGARPDPDLQYRLVKARVVGHRPQTQSHSLRHGLRHRLVRYRRVSDETPTGRGVPALP